ncbi:MAG: acyl carrier protein [Pseudomonadota bacterium]
MEEIFDKVKKVILNTLAVGESRVVPEASFVDDLDADSLDIINLIQALEKELSVAGRTVKIEEEEAEDIQTVQQLVDLFSKKVS